MPTLLRIPEIASGATHATLQAWTKKSGDSVAAGECLAEIETDKAVVELVAEHEGTLGRLFVEAGAEVPIGEAIGELLAPGEKAAEPAAVASTAPSAEPASVKPEALTESEPGNRLRVSPIARRLAREFNVDLAALKGSGPHGRILRRDVEAARTARPSVAAQPRYAQPAPIPADQAFREVPHSAMRRTIARRLAESKASVPHFYLTARCRVDRLLELRGQVNGVASRKVSINDFVVRAVALALKEVPQANVAWTDAAMRHFSTADVSVAVSVEGGLFTPVVRGADAKSLTAISEEISDFAERARDGKLAPDEYQGGSISVSNLGMFGVEEFTAIVNPPQAAILAVGAVRPEVVADGDAMRVANLMSCTLSVDHRAIDGALAAKWLGCFKRLVENPFLLLI